MKNFEAWNDFSESYGKTVQPSKVSTSCDLYLVTESPDQSQNGHNMSAGSIRG